MSYYTTYLELNPCGWERYYRAMCVEDPPLPLPEWVRAAERYGRVLVHWRAHGGCPDHFDEVLRKMGLEKADYRLYARSADDPEWTIVIGDLESRVFDKGMAPDLKDWSPIEMSFVVPDPPDVQILRLLNRIYGQIVTQTDLLKDIKDQLDRRN